MKIRILAIALMLIAAGQGSFAQSSPVKLPPPPPYEQKPDKGAAPRLVALVVVVASVMSAPTFQDVLDGETENSVIPFWMCFMTCIRLCFYYLAVFLGALIQNAWVFNVRWSFLFKAIGL